MTAAESRPATVTAATSPTSPTSLTSAPAAPPLASPPTPNAPTRPAAPPGGSVPAVRRLLDWRVRFAALGLVWGFSFLFMKVGNEAFAPLQVTLGRMVFGTAVLAVAVAVKRERLPRGPRTYAHLAVAAFLLNSLPFSLFATAEQTIPSMLAGICNAATPLFSMLISVVALSEDRPSRQRFAGVGLGFAGVLTVLGAWQGFSGQDPKGTVMALAAALSYAVGWAYVRRTLARTGGSHLSMSATQLTLGTVQLLLVTPFFTSVPHDWPAKSVLSVLALGALGTGVAFLIQYGLVAEKGPTIGSMVTYLIPIVATTAGVLLLNESLSWNEPVGAVVILIGAALTQLRPRATRRA
ncbi:Permease of the drug/metabolite transporter (DMT) superfamily [Streptomyces sp. DvalAA-14]|uniref:DMT family transporter n=1 Tax=unclassified Streptomyces TaxID=2593676 RepID=UPI00081B5924|nr:MULTISPECIES: DMT family transporter [unclassified Streptomyces]MYS19146.1 EamA family transporter [Streptomyces sp. SID4948]SCD37836.1 Permease of the drug/metabolite transporter (DMT) superfamily [Streptomyces sp. DvalAA-14]